MSEEREQYINAFKRPNKGLHLKMFSCLCEPKTKINITK